MSNNLPGNPHEEDAMMYSCEASEIQAHEDHERLILAQQATTHATLALAYEQRTTTLVHALLSDSLVTDGKYDELQAEVRQRLGLGENK
ncbi:hypothetical protein ACTXM3_11885 [Glutamicibacter arilaitensis]|uniref:hypothetical protein n=1 Tax=Glutamicibacter arilaitensis TaxID=256701 RepID=UPI003FD3E372